MNILISGYYGFGNLGDELILKNIRNELERRFPGAGITVLSSCPADTRHCHGVNALSRWNPIRVSVAMWKSDLFILGGGGLIQDHTSSRSLLYYAGVLMLAWVFRVPSFLFSVGVERVSGSVLPRALAFLLNQPFVTVSVRDEVSNQSLLSLGVKRIIHVTADPVFLTELPATVHHGSETAAPHVLFIPRFSSSVDGIPLYESLLDHVRRVRSLSVKTGLFQPIVEQAFGVATSFDGKPVDMTLRWLEGVTHVVSARFHGLVLAAMSGKPFLGIGDPQKTGRFCEFWGMPFLSWDSDAVAVQQALDRLFEVGPNPHGIDGTALRQKAAETVRLIP